MSRSFKKNSKGWLCSGNMKKWKRMVNKELRKKIDLPKYQIGDIRCQRALYKRVSDIFNSPSDGKVRLDWVYKNYWFDMKSYKVKGK